MRKMVQLKIKDYINDDLQVKKCEKRHAINWQIMIAEKPNYFGKYETSLEKHTKVNN